jgi:tRNA threonylcarbamoyladenosine biosynthesis protein TsaB
MALILCIESATKVCSVVLAQDGLALSTQSFKSEKFSHAEKLNDFILNVFQDSGKKINELDAVAVSAGPGSYTGLRIGTSTAKGICYALDLPLISINSLKSLAVLSNTREGLICPMFDARRMEVFTAIYSRDLNEVRETHALVLDEMSFADIDQTITFLGPGAEKSQEMLKGGKFIFDLTTEVSAMGMVKLAEEKFEKANFESVAYFEPAYLKDFVAGPPKKVL